MGSGTPASSDTVSRPAARSPSPARQTALAVLARVERGALANQVLEQRLSAGGMDAGARALATALVEGTLRNRTWLDHVLAQASSNPLDRLHPLILNVLRMGAFQLLFHERQPAPLVVSDSVNLARRCGHEGTAALVNAVLRSVVRSADTSAGPDPCMDPLGYVNVRLSHPDWLARRWVERFGAERAIAIARVNNEAPQASVRINPLRADVESLTAAFAAEGLAPPAGALVPGMLRLRGHANLAQTQAYREGRFSIQGEGSALAGLLAAPAPGARVVDMCAGAGGKTTHLAQLMQDQGEIIACDVDRRRLGVLQAECRRLGIGIIETRRQDARTLPASQDFDACLLDAPCSGTGSIRRRPDIRWRRTEADLAPLAQLQAGLLAAAGGLVRRGGCIVYCTCSLEPEENEQVVGEFLAARQDFRPVDCRGLLPMLGPDDFAMDGRAALLLPHRYGTDGMFIARLERL